MTHIQTESMSSVRADSAETLVMFAGLMMAFIYHGNAYEAVKRSLADIPGISDMHKCCTSLDWDACPSITALNESFTMARCTRCT